MDVELTSNRSIGETEKRAKENSSAAGNHGDGHMNGMSNGFDRRKEHKSERKDKDRSSHKSEHREKDRVHEKTHKSERKDKEKDKDRHKHSATKDKHGSSSSSTKEKDKKSTSKDKEHKSSSSSISKDKEREKSREHHKSSSSSKDKDKEKHHSSSKEKDSSKSKDKDKHSHDKSKDKDRRHNSSSKSEKHSIVAGSSSEKEKNRSSEKDHRHRHDREKDKDRHRHDKDRTKSRDDREKRENEIKEEKIKVEDDDNKAWVKNHQSEYNHESESPVKREENSQSAEDDDDEDDDSSREPNLYIKEEDDECAADNSIDSNDGNDTRLSELHNTTIKDDDSDEDMPLSARKSTSNIKRKVDSSDDEEEVPLSARKKIKKESKKKKKRKRSVDSEDEIDSEEEKKLKKKKAQKSSRNSSASNSGNTPSPKKKKKDDEEQEVWKWWEEDKKSDGTKWTFLEHKGPVFAPEYEPLPSNVKFYYNGKEMRLSEPTEEVATFYARMLDHDYTTKKIFNNNFFVDWREVMTESERSKIMDLSKCNFKEIHQYFLQKSEERKAMSKEEKKAIKEKNDEIAKEYGICTIDGHREKIGNFKIEPPGLFRGRGEHPKMGKLKKRVNPEDVMINCSKDSVFPRPPSGHKWKEIRHDSSVTWLASWIENVQGQVKYVMLNPSSKLKGEKDWQKYEIARKLAKSIDKIRKEYREDWKSKEMRIRQRAVALYFIDKLALRAGNEKDEDQADTVGCCSLRVEHISLHEHKDGKDYVVVFDFLGKDSIRYYNEVPVEKRVFKNLQLFKENKSDGDDLFDRLNTSVMNKHLNELMEGLTAKVFRTYNASWTLQQQLEELTSSDDILAQKILSYNRANRAVAILCNHQRSVPKTHAKSMENLKAKIDAKKSDIAAAEQDLKSAKREAKSSQKGKELFEKAKKKLERLQEQLKKLELQATDREENKDIALGTSKLNYLDPRITVAWCKKNDVPIEKIYNKTQRSKFRWAIDMAGPDFVF